MDDSMPDDSDDVIPCPSAVGECPTCAVPIRDLTCCSEGHWDGSEGGGVLYGFQCPVCKANSISFARFDQAVEELERIGIATNGSVE